MSTAYIWNLTPLAIKLAEHKIWEKLVPKEVFVVRRRGGFPLYCSVMGAAGENLALTIYAGDENYQHFLSTTKDTSNLNPAELQELLTSANCYMVSFETREDIDNWNAEITKIICGRIKHKMGKDFLYPLFQKFEERKAPTQEFNTSDATIVETGLMAALEVADKLSVGMTPRGLGFRDALPMNRPAPILHKKKEAWEWGTITLPDEKPKVYESFTAVDDILLTKVKDQKRLAQVDWFVEILVSPELVRVKPRAQARFPLIQVVMECGDRLVFKPEMENFTQDYRILFNCAILNRMLEQGIPTALYVGSDRALACYGELAHRLNIPIENRPAPP